MWLKKAVEQTHDLRRIYAGTYYFDAYFRIILDDLLVNSGMIGRLGKRIGEWRVGGGLT